MDRRQLLVMACVGAVPTWAAAQDPEYPKPGVPIRYIVPFPPGGLTDAMARLVGQQLSTRWKVAVVVDNKAGGGGLIGADFVAKAPADGETLLAVTMTHAVNATLFRGKSPYDFERDLKAVALLAGSPMLVVVPANSPIHDMKELLAAAKSRRLNAGSSGNGTPPHLTLALFNQLNKTDIQHIPYKGGAPSMNDLVGGQLDVVFSNFPESIAQVKAGKLRALAIASAKRNPQLPDVPTTAEAGMPDLLVDNWTAVMVPAATPAPVVQKLGNELVQVLAQPDVADKAVALGFRPDPRGPAECAAFIRDETQRWARVIQQAGIHAD